MTKLLTGKWSGTETNSIVFNIHSLDQSALYAYSLLHSQAALVQNVNVIEDY